MARNFSADIELNPSKSGNIVSIIPFSDKDKVIAKHLENILNYELRYNNDVKIDLDDLAERIIRDYI